MNLYLRTLFFAILGAVVFTSCEDDDNLDPVIPPIMGTVAPNVGGPEQPNQVYVDLSTGSTTVVPRSSWDFGFYGGEEFRVILNSANGMLAAQTNYTNFADVSSLDTLGFLGGVLDMDALFGILVSQALPPWFQSAANWIDHPDGDIEKTAWTDIDALDENNMVYIVNRGKNADGSNRGLIKMLVQRASNGYNITYGNMDDTIGNTLTVEKNSNYNFTFISVDQGIVQVEPPKNEWDIAFSTFSDYVPSNFISGYPVPYVVNDFIFSNRTGVQIATIESTDALSAYNAVTFEEVSGLSFTPDANAIGTDWRTVANPQEPGSITAPKGDRYYIIQDADGRNYKVLLTQMTSSDGLRGFPEFIYEELK